MSVIETRITQEGPFEITKEMNVPLPGQMAITVMRVVYGAKKMWTQVIGEEMVSQAADPWELGDCVARYLMQKLNQAEGIS